MTWALYFPTKATPGATIYEPSTGPSEETPVVLAGIRQRISGGRRKRAIVTHDELAAWRFRFEWLTAADVAERLAFQTAARGRSFELETDAGLFTVAFMGPSISFAPEKTRAGFHAATEELEEQPS